MADSLNKITPAGTTSILTYDDIQTRTLDSIRIGSFCGKYLSYINNVFIGFKAGRLADKIENSIYLGHNAGELLPSGFQNIIIGTNQNFSDNLNNSTTIGNNFNSSRSTAIGYFNSNIGEANTIIGFNSSNFGSNLLSLGNNIYNKNSSIFFHNGLPIINPIISFNSNHNFIYNGYSSLSSNDVNSNTINPIITSNIEFKRKNLINDFISPFLKKDCIIIQGKPQIIYNNSTPIIPTQSISLLPNQIYNLKNYSSPIQIPTSIIKRISPPILNPISRDISFNSSLGFIPTNYNLHYLISSPPIFGSFNSNQTNNLIFDNSTTLIYYYNPAFPNLTDTTGITPFIEIDNQLIKGNETFISFNRNLSFPLSSNNIISSNYPIFSKEILFKYDELSIDVIAFDYVILKNHLINNIANFDYNELHNIIISFYQEPNYGFISDINRFPIASCNILQSDNIIYQNYNNINNFDYFKINFSYGYNFANINDLTIKINIINNNIITFQNNFIYDLIPTKNNLLSSSLPTFILDYSLNPDLINFDNHYLYHSNLINKNIYNPTLKLITNSHKEILFDNQNFYNFFGSISFNLFYNYFINSNSIILDNNNYDYQFINYYLPNLSNLISIDIDVKPNVLFPFPNISNVYNFNLSLYSNNYQLSTYNFNNNNSLLDFNVYNNIHIQLTSPPINANNFRFEFFMSSNIISYQNLHNYITELSFRNLILEFNDNNDDINIAIGKEIKIKGRNNLAIGSNINIIGSNSIVFGNNKNKNPIHNSIIIGNNNLPDSFINNSIIIGNNNKSSIINSNQIIIGSDIDNKFLLNINNTICSDNNLLYIGLDKKPVAIGYNSNDAPQSLNSNISLFLKDGIYTSNITIYHSNNTITLKNPDNLTSNITYTLPTIPKEFIRIIMSCDNKGNLKWTETSTFDINTNLNVSNIITNNIYASGFIFGIGSNLRNVNISDRTTDLLLEGSSNLYYTNERASNIFFSYINTNINSDLIKEGSNNLYYTSTRDSNNFFSNLNKISTNDIKEGSNNLYFNYNSLANSILKLFNSYTTDSLKEGSTNFYITQSKVNEFISKKTTDDFKSGSNNKFFTNELANSNINNFINNITTDNIKEGSSNLYFNNPRLLSNLNVILNTKTTDELKEGNFNRYYNQSNANYTFDILLSKKTTADFKESGSNLYFNLNRFNSYLQTKNTDDIKEGTSNFYLTTNRLINLLGTLNSDLIKEGSINKYYTEKYAQDVLTKSLSLLTTDIIKEGSNNKFITNNTYNSNLNVNGSIFATNVYINNSNMLDIYNESLANSQSNYAKIYTKYTTASNIILNNSNSPIKLNIQLNSNFQSTSLANGVCPFIIVGSNVGINILNPYYNLHVNGIAYANYFIGDGRNITNLNVNNININTDDIKQANKNKFIVNNIYDNNLTISGDVIFNNSLIKGDIIPFTNNIYKIGNSSSYISNIFTSQLSLNNSLITTEGTDIAFNDINNSSNKRNLKTSGIIIQHNSNNFLQLSYNLNNLIITSNGLFKTSNLLDFEFLSNSPIIYSNNYNSTKIDKELYSSNIIINNNLKLFTSNNNALLQTLNRFSFITNNSNSFSINSNEIIINGNLIINNLNHNLLAINTSNKLDNLTTDLLSIGSSNRFISNDIYERNLKINGLLTTSNVSIIGNLTSIESPIYHNKFFIIDNKTNSNSFTINHNNANPFQVIDNQGFTTFIINSNSNIGIGTSTPKFKLDVLGTINTNDIIINNLPFNIINSNNSNNLFSSLFDLTIITSNVLFNSLSNIDKITSNEGFKFLSNLNTNTSNTLFNNFSKDLNQTSNFLSTYNYNLFISTQTNIQATSNRLFSSLFNISTNNTNNSSNKLASDIFRITSNDIITSNKLFNDIINNSNLLSINFSNLNSNSSNFLTNDYSNLIFNSSNSLFSSNSNNSNLIFIDYSNLNRTSSNSLFLLSLNNSNILFRNTSNTSNSLSSLYTINSNKLSNDIYNISLNSNILFKNYSNINQISSNKLATDIYNVSLNSAGISNTSNILFKDYSNINQISSNKLAIDIYNVSLNSAGISNTSNILFKDYSNLNLTNSNFINNNIIFTSNIIYNNYTNLNTQTSNKLISDYNFRFININTDTLISGNTNRFIINDTYNRNVAFTKTITASNIITSNINVIGDFTTLQTNVYQTEQFQVINDSTATALYVKQIGVNKNVAEFYYQGNNVALTINPNGYIGIGKSIASYNLDVAGSINALNIFANNQNVMSYIEQNSNKLFIDDINNSNKLFNNFKSDITINSNKLFIDNYNNSNKLFIDNYNNSNNLFKSSYDMNLYNSNNLFKSSYDINLYNSNNLFKSSYDINLYNSNNLINNITTNSNKLFLNSSNDLYINSNKLFLTSSNNIYINSNNLTSFVNYQINNSSNELLNNINYSSNQNKNNITNTSNNLISFFNYEIFLTSNKLNTNITNNFNIQLLNTSNNLNNIFSNNLFITSNQLLEKIKTTSNISSGNTTIDNSQLITTSNNLINYTNYTSNQIIAKLGQGNTSNLAYEIQKTSNNLLLITNNKFNSLNTDLISQGSSNRYITNNTYNGDVNFTNSIFASNITTSNLQVIGTSTIIYTDVYQTDILDITNNSTGTAMTIRQLGIAHNVAEFYNKSKLAMIITSNGNVGISKYNPNPIYKLDVNGQINCLDINVNENSLTELIELNISNARYLNTYAYNSTLVDFTSIITSNSFIVNSPIFTDTHFCTYKKYISDSELLIQADFPYKIDGYGSDSYASRLVITSELDNTPEYSIEHEQIFIGYAAGGGTRSTTLSPINHKTNINGNFINIKVQLRLVDSDNIIQTDKCVFIITEKKPSSKLILTDYITPEEVVSITSNLYINPEQLSNVLNNYQTNDVGVWDCNALDNSLYYMGGRVGIGISFPIYNLEVAGTFNANDVFISDTSVNTLIANSATIINDKIDSLNANLIADGTFNRFIVNNNYNAGDVYFADKIYSAGLISSNLIINANNNQRNLAEFYNSGNLNVVINPIGNLGIGVSSPNYELDINGDVNCSNVLINNINIFDTISNQVNLTSNLLFSNTIATFNRLQNSNLIGFNSTLVDFKAINTSNSFIVSSTFFTDTHSCVYKKYFPDSELLIQADFPYKIEGYGSDTYASRLMVSSDLLGTPNEYSLEHQQIFIGYAAGGGTRSTTLSPLNYKTEIAGNNITIKVQLKLIDSDNYITTDRCVFIITEKKPTEKLVLSTYITALDLPNLTSNLYINPDQLANILLNYQTNNYGKWTCNYTDNSIYYNAGRVGIGLTSPNYELDINGEINCSHININNVSLIQSFNNHVQATSNILSNFTIETFNRLQNSNLVGYNSTLIDFKSFNTSNSFIISSSIFTNTHSCVYKKFFPDSELLIQADFPYKIEGYGSDTYSSRLMVSSDLSGIPNEYSLEHEQVFIGYAAGGGTRSTTLSPLNYKTEISGTDITINVQIKLTDSDNYITTDKCVFIITEKKPSSRIVFTSYLNETDIPRVTSNLYINSNQLSNVLLDYQTNNYGKWTCNYDDNSIYYNGGKIGMGITHPNYYLDINGDLNCSQLYRNGISLNTTLDDYITSNNIKYVLNNNIVGYNTSLVDFDTIITSNSFIVNSSEFTNTHTCSYNKFFIDNELLIQVDFPYTIDGYGSDSYSSRLEITSELINNPEYSLEHEQVFIGYAAGGGTRSTTLSPLSHRTNMKGNLITIKVQIKLSDSDDFLKTDKCVFIITEKIPKSKIYFTNYINETDIPRLTSNLYISPQQLTSNFNNYGKWNCNFNNSNIYYNDGFVGIGTNNPQDKLHIAGNIISNGSIISHFSDIRLKSITSTLNNPLDTICKINGFKYKPNQLAGNYGFDTNKEMIGVNAQEISNYIPEIINIAPFDITKDENGDIVSKSGNNYLTIQYEQLIPYLIESIKELKKENDILNIKLNKLEQQLL